jgi:hypothetical protein
LARRDYPINYLALASGKMRSIKRECTGAAENVKEVAELIKRYNNLELNRKIVALEDEVLELTRDKRRLENKVEEQERALKFQGDLHSGSPSTS